MSKLDDLLGKKKEIVPVLDLSKTIVHTKEEYKRLSEKVPDYKMRPIKVIAASHTHPCIMVAINLILLYFVHTKRFAPKTSKSKNRIVASFRSQKRNSNIWSDIVVNGKRPTSIWTPYRPKCGPLSSWNCVRCQSIGKC